MKPYSFSSLSQLHMTLRISNLLIILILFFSSVTLATGKGLRNREENRNFPVKFHNKKEFKNNKREDRKMNMKQREELKTNNNPTINFRQDSRNGENTPKVHAGKNIFNTFITTVTTALEPKK